MRRTSFVMDEHDYQKVVKIAEEFGMSVSNLMRRIIKRAVDDPNGFTIVMSSKPAQDAQLGKSTIDKEQADKSAYEEARRKHYEEFPDIPFDGDDFERFSVEK